jgi:4-aminobutyrate aminotransferase
VWDADGHEYLDFSAGAAVANTGYGHPRVVNAVIEQVGKLTHGATVVFPNQPTVELAEQLTKVTPGDFEKKVWFGTSGSDACESVYDFLPSATRRRRIISFFGSHHGLTVGTNFLSGHKVSSRYLASPTVVKVPFPSCYRMDVDSPEECTKYCIDFIERHVFPNICPPEDTAGILVEPIESLAGEIVPPDDFLPELRRLCDRHGILLAADEVKTGFGRTGRMFAAEHTGTVPDIVILGKPIASGLPLSACVGRRELLDAEPVSHASSAAAHPICCAAGLATLAVLKAERLAENAANQGDYIRQRFEEMMQRHALIGDVRGKGLMIGVELVRDRKTKRPANTEALKLSYRAWQRGLLFLTVGTYSNVAEITPPLVIGREQVDKGLAILEEALRDVGEGRVPDSVLDFRSW